ncbi:MAG: hypothetical protein RMA76_27920 [Deltaproteobacteria bacterium]|jgi:hypothetical protein
MRVAANPVELAVAAALATGQTDAAQVETFAADFAQTLASQGVETDGWQGALGRWTADLTPSALRTQAHAFLKDNREVLHGLASQIEAVARLPGATAAQANRATLVDFLFQLGRDATGAKTSPSEAVGSKDFLDAGRFAFTPPGTTVHAEMGVGDKRKTAYPVDVDTSLLDTAAGRRLSSAMTTQWGFLQARGVEGGDNINTLTRHAYNQYGVAQILEGLEDRDVRDARVLLVTGYETPLEDLLASDRVGEVVVADLSEQGARTVADKYAHHPQARKLKVKVADFSGQDARAQSDAADALLASGTSLGEVTRDWFSAVAAGRHQTDVDFATDAFDAVHLPFVAGSMHLGPLTTAIAETHGGYQGYDDFVGAAALATPEAADAAVASMKHVFDQARRITKDGGTVVANLWARPQVDEGVASIRLSDTAVSPDAFDSVVDGLERRFSGNPQPTLPHTVGHVFASTH